MVIKTEYLPIKVLMMIYEGGPFSPTLESEIRACKCISHVWPKILAINKNFKSAKNSFDYFFPAD